jgi:hypothetical protein
MIKILSKDKKIFLVAWRSDILPKLDIPDLFYKFLMDLSFVKQAIFSR